MLEAASGPKTPKADRRNDVPNFEQLEALLFDLHFLKGMSIVISVKTQLAHTRLYCRSETT